MLAVLVDLENVICNLPNDPTCENSQLPFSLSLP